MAYLEDLLWRSNFKSTKRFEEIPTEHHNKIFVQRTAAAIADYMEKLDDGWHVYSSNAWRDYDEIIDPYSTSSYTYYYCDKLWFK